MKVTRENRTLVFSDLPSRIGGLSNPLAEVRVCLNYEEVLNDGNRLSKALVLDGLILPAIVRALGGEEAAG